MTQPGYRPIGTRQTGFQGQFPLPTTNLSERFQELDIHSRFTTTKTNASTRSLKINIVYFHKLIKLMRCEQHNTFAKPLSLIYRFMTLRVQAILTFQRTPHKCNQGGDPVTVCSHPQPIYGKNGNPETSESRRFRIPNLFHHTAKHAIGATTHISFYSKYLLRPHNRPNDPERCVLNDILCLFYKIKINEKPVLLHRVNLNPEMTAKSTTFLPDTKVRRTSVLFTLIPAKTKARISLCSI